MYDIELIELDSPRALEAEWAALYARAARPYVSRSFAWNLIVWETVGRPRGRDLFCVVGRRDGHIVMLWPLTRGQQGGVRILRPLGPEAHEYASVLIQAGEDEAALIGQAVALLKEKRVADVLDIPCIPAESALHRVLAQNRGVGLSLTMPAPWISWDGFADWQSFYRARLSKSHRENHARKRKRLAATGELTFERPATRERQEQLARWMIDRKREWLVQTRERNNWFPSPECPAFFTRMLTEAPDSVAIFALCVDGVPVAAELSCITDWCVEMLNCTFDPAFGKYSPGELLREHCLQWTFDKGLNYDFRLGTEPYKLTWANRDAMVYDHLIACSWKGVSFIAAKRWPGVLEARARKTAGKYLPKELRMRIKRLVRGCAPAAA